jgi:hypothetical protein
MPYFLYRITPQGPIRTLAHLDQFDAFKPASDEAKRLRRELDLTPGEQVKVIFAENQLQAEDLLSQVREDEPRTGEDY